VSPGNPARFVGREEGDWQRNVIGAAMRVAVDTQCEISSACVLAKLDISVEPRPAQSPLTRMPALAQR